MPGLRFHERPALLKQVSAVVCGFDFVRNDMREGSLCKVARVAMFARPIPKARPKTMCGCDASSRVALSLDTTKQRGQQ